MKKLHSLTFYALAMPVITLGTGSVLAQQSTGRDSDRQLQSTQRDQGSKQSTTRKQSDRSTKRDKDSKHSSPGSKQSEQGTHRIKHIYPQTAADR